MKRIIVSFIILLAILGVNCSFDTSDLLVSPVCAEGAAGE